MIDDDQRPVIIIRLWDNNGEPILGAEGIALLYGTSVDELRALATPGDFDPTTLPLELRKQGRRRAREAVAATGIDSLQSCLEYWADREQGADIKLQLQGVLSELPDPKTSVPMNGSAS
jgi:hypothetical protein